jgi:hypothetical protein
MLLFFARSLHHHKYFPIPPIQRFTLVVDEPMFCDVYPIVYLQALEDLWLGFFLFLEKYHRSLAAPQVCHGGLEEVDPFSYKKHQ